MHSFRFGSEILNLAVRLVNHLSGQEKQDLARCFARPIWDVNELLARDLQMKSEELKVEH
jgi:hypothetical protein